MHGAWPKPWQKSVESPSGKWISGATPHPQGKGWDGAKLPGVPALTWSLVHSRSQVLWASTHRLGLSWLGHRPGWFPSSGTRPAPKASLTMRNRGRNSCRAGMGTTGPGGKAVWLPAPPGAPEPSALQASTLWGYLADSASPLMIPWVPLWPLRLEPTANAPPCPRRVGFGISELCLCSPAPLVPLSTTAGHSQVLVSIGRGGEAGEGPGLNSAQGHRGAGKG